MQPLTAKRQVAAMLAAFGFGLLAGIVMQSSQAAFFGTIAVVVIGCLWLWLPARPCRKDVKLRGWAYWNPKMGYHYHVHLPKLKRVTNPEGK